MTFPAVTFLLGKEREIIPPQEETHRTMVCMAISLRIISAESTGGARFRGGWCAAIYAKRAGPNRDD